MVSTSPVLVLIKANGCGACERLSQIWNECLRVMKEVVPNLVEVVIAKPTFTSAINTNNYPAVLSAFTWFPTLLLVPGKSWNDAMLQTNLGASSIIHPLLGSQIFNGEWLTTTTVKQHTGKEVKYNLLKPQDYRAWISAAIRSEEFVRANMTPLPAPPVIASSSSSAPAIINPNEISYRATVCKPGYSLVSKIGAHSR